jgi:hypothetical protein
MPLVPRGHHNNKQNKQDQLPDLEAVSGSGSISMPLSMPSSMPLATRRCRDIDTRRCRDIETLI